MSPSGASESEWIESSLSPAWPAALRKLPAQIRDIYSQPEYLWLYEDAEQTAHCFVYREDERTFVYPFMLRPIPGSDGLTDISTPYGYGGPVTSDSDPAFIGRARMEFLHCAQGRGVIAELIKFHPLLGNHVLMESQLRVIPVCPVVYVDLGVDPAERWRHVYTHANRKNINKAARSGIKISFDGGDEQWSAFRRLYAQTLKANSAASFYEFSDAYFRGIRERLASRHILVTAVLNDVIVCGLIVLLGAENAHCHLIGTDRVAMSNGVNNLLHHELVGWAAGHGYKRLLVGGGRGNSEDDSLLRFKRNFSDLSATFFVGESVIAGDAYQQLCDEWRATYPERDRNDRLLLYRL